MFGRCYVEVPLKKYDRIGNCLTTKVYFKHYNTAHIFAYRYTKRNKCFVRIFEYQPETYENDFTEGFHWIVSIDNGRICASWSMTAIELERILKNG